MVVDLIGIYGLKGPYCTLTMTDWFLQALSVIPRGSWGDVARRFTMIRWAAQNPPLLSSPSAAAAAAARCRRKFVSGQLDEENPFVLISSPLLVQPDEGVSVLVVDRIGDYLPESTEKSRVLVIPIKIRLIYSHATAACGGSPPRASHARHDTQRRASCATPSRAGRAMDSCWSHAGRATVAGGVERCFAGVAAMRCRTMRAGGGTMLRRRLEGWRHGLVAGRPKCTDDGARSRMKRRSSSGRARALVPPRFFVAAAASRPPLRRRSGHVVTAGLNSSRFWFELVPGNL
ncbi:hypothetical protein F511_45067 [Dorcoceras hygrometricum]|uniref:Uncharacterized protein n=1 Tax=Dorcoceras hygrometricum TaxID=472368 RepID=A0A2Z6ZX54_9LAMI|nr:hypothetical protein F511_45067 [Dorcoceras hygrometricum]